MNEEKERIVFISMNRLFCTACNSLTLHNVGSVIMDGSHIGEVKQCLRCQNSIIRYDTDIVVV